MKMVKCDKLTREIIKPKAKEILVFYKPIYDKLSKKRKKDLCKIIIEYFINELNILNSKK